MTPLHLGPLHPVEQWLTLLLAFGPFVLLAGVVWWRRREVVRDEALRSGAEPEDADEQAATGTTGTSPPRTPRA